MERGEFEPGPHPPQAHANHLCSGVERVGLLGPGSARGPWGRGGPASDIGARGAGASPGGGCAVQSCLLLTGLCPPPIAKVGGRQVALRPLLRQGPWNLADASSLQEGSVPRETFLSTGLRRD